ncbi:hypothetical protein MJ1_0423 [Nanobdella aerobiophila]|uniref:Uncharacterized protein n=1 Tax=Nanobdella aerobiophila TaxID=2586965 RepID=A0A915SFA1_9ARCH|nr:hypothetical protein [Nanobdella aerobiophila]BBL45585.1 hypothetical protein MJ1_0423 [Nanobdella aerobiophila]
MEKVEDVLELIKNRSMARKNNLSKNVKVIRELRKKMAKEIASMK